MFRDVGLVATRRFLERGLSRLAGPLSPITYMRSADYVEPYVDYERTGRLVLLAPRGLGVWHSGVPNIFVADARVMPAEEELAWVPGGIALAEAARLLADVRTAGEAREALGGVELDRARADTQARLEVIEAEAAEAEALAEPLRRAFTSRDERARDRARSLMEQLEISELDLCAAWHHLPRARRDHLRTALASLARSERGEFHISHRSPSPRAGGER
jgi:hypothetical protein